jgi:hypothetical protein
MAESNLFQAAPQRSKLQKFGEMLGGFGAGVQGRGQEYLTGLQERRANEEKKRLTAMVKDAKTTYDYLNKGDVNNAMSLIQDRVQMIGELGGDPSDTARIGAMLESGRIAEAQNELRGFLRPFMPTEAIKASELTPTGQRVTFDPLTQTTTAEDVAGFRAEPEEDKTFEKESGFRKEFNAIPSVKNFAVRANALGSIEASAADPSPAGDVSLIFAYMRMLDPNSTVREGEFATAENAGSVPQTVRAKYNRILTGERLDPDVRQDFVDTANRIYDRAASDFGSLYTRYEDIAKASNLDPSKALIDYRFPSPSVELPQSAVEQGVTPEVWGAMTPEQRALFN